MADEQNQSFTAKLLVEVRSSILDLINTLGSAKSATAEYGKSLNNFTSIVPNNSTREDLNTIVRGMLQDTWKMAEGNLKLETHLDRASHKVGELGQYLESASKEAMTDSLTGIPNRRAFDKQIISSIEESIINKAPLVILLIDIDHFKKFNDTHGHVVGDQVLRLVSRVLVRNIKVQDMGARYGGEEFAILLPATSLGNGLNVAERLRRLVENKELIDRVTDKNLGQITLSIGIAEYREGEDVISFIKRGDTALYQAKEKGRNCVCTSS